MQFSPGQLLNETYRIDRLLGRGGMASVYVVEHVRLPRRFAVKMLAGDWTHDPAVLRRFRREAEILASLQHPHIVSVIDWNEFHGHPYLVMELLEGEDLAAHLQRLGGPMDVPTAVGISIQVAEALATSHAAGVIHRDLKPSNIFLCRGGPFPNCVKVLDFGIAALRFGQSLPVTTGNLLLGTPAYMAPEQAQGRTELVDERADQFSLALILYEMLSGQSAFFRQGDPAFTTLYRVVHEDPPLLTSISAEFQQILQRALHKDPGQRFPSVQAFIRALVDQRGDAAVPGSHPVGILLDRGSSEQMRGFPATLGHHDGPRGGGGHSRRIGLGALGLLLALLLWKLGPGGTGSGENTFARWQRWVNFISQPSVFGPVLAVACVAGLSGLLALALLRTCARSFDRHENSQAISPQVQPMASPLLKTGASVAGYQLIAKLADSALGTVWQAENAVDVVAIHFLDACKRDGATEKRFINGARAINKLHHAAIARVLAFGELPDGTAYVVNEHLRGMTLRQRLADALTPLTEKDVIWMGTQLASALAAAHQIGVIHRHLTPDKIMLWQLDGTTAAIPKILDFAIAKLKAEHCVPDAEAVHTYAGPVPTIAVYMAPEQCITGVEVDEKVDVYQLGILFQEMLTGRSPHVGTDLGKARLHLATEKPTSLAAAAQPVSDGLAALIERMLTKSPRERPTMNEVLQRLHELQDDRQPTRLSVRTSASRSHSPPSTVATHAIPAEGESLAEFIAPQPTYDVFLIYHPIDDPLLQPIRQQLEARQLRTCLITRDARPGCPADAEMRRLASLCHAAAIFFGNGRPDRAQERERNALLKEFVNRDCPVIIVLLQPCPDEPVLHPALQETFRVDFRREEPDPFEQLYFGITGKRREGMSLTVEMR